jgi:hypothetical protein
MRIAMPQHRETLKELRGNFYAAAATLAVIMLGVFVVEILAK